MPFRSLAVKQQNILIVIEVAGFLFWIKTLKNWKLDTHFIRLRCWGGTGIDVIAVVVGPNIR